MKDHDDIYNETLIRKYSDAETGGVREQGGNKGISEGDLCAVPEGFKGGNAKYCNRGLFQYGVQSNGCNPEIKWAGTGESGYHASASQEPYLWTGGLIGLGAAVWEAAGFSCSTRLRALIPLWMPWIREQFRLNQQGGKQGLSMSARQIDRRLKDKRERIYGRTNPGTLLKHDMPIQIDNGDIKTPGGTEIDTGSHSGNNAEGKFAYTRKQTDILPPRVESRAVLGKAEDPVAEGIDDMAKALPFILKGLDSDNGSGFVNWHVWRYCKRKKMQPFRGRPWKKDDHAHREQKNCTHVRKLMGWDRYDSQEAGDAMNDLYRNELRLFSGTC